MLALDFLRGLARRRCDPARDALEGGKQIRNRATLGDVHLDPSRLDRDAAAAHDERGAFGLQRSHDDLRCPNELTDADHGRVGERSRRRHLETLERFAPLFSSNRVGPERLEIVAQEHGCRFRQPENATLARDVLEGHDEYACRWSARGDSSVTRGDHSGRPGRGLSDGGRGRDEKQRERENASHAASGSARGFASRATFRTQEGSPVPRQATTLITARTLNSASIREYAAA